MTKPIRGHIELVDDELRIRRDLSGEIGTLVPNIDYCVEFGSLAYLEACIPWPRLRVRMRDGEDLTVSPAHGVDDEAMAAEVARIFEWARASRARLSRGWLALPIVEWERATEWPTEQKPHAGGAFRTAASVSDPVIAERARPSTLERLLGWIATSNPSGDDEVAVTKEFLYRRRARRIERIPRDALTSILRNEQGDRVLVFGRCTRLLLLGRSTPCPVVDRLEADLRR